MEQELAERNQAISVIHPARVAHRPCRWTCLLGVCTLLASGDVQHVGAQHPVVLHEPVVIQPSSMNLSADLSLRVRDAIQGLDPERLPSLDRAQQACLKRIANAQAFFQQKTSADNYDRWMAYLDLEPLIEAIESNQSPSKQLARANELGNRLVGLAPGLELTRLVELRRGVNQLIAAIKFRDADRSIKIMTRQLEELAEQIEQMDPIPSAEEAAKINAIVGILAEANQTPALISALRTSFGRPNLRMYVPESTIQDVVQRNVNQCSSVDDCILGTRLIGTANLQGTVQADLLPASGEVRMALTLNGQVATRNVGYNGPVKLHTVSNAWVQVTRALHLNEQRVTLDPPSTQVSQNTKITSIQHRLRLVRRIARKRAAEQKAQADAIAREKLRKRVGDGFVEETDQVASVQLPDFLAEARPILKRLDLPEPSRWMSSTDRAMYVEAQMANPAQLTAINPPPPVNGSVDFAFQVHESVLENALSPLLAGRTFSGEEIDDLLAAAGLPTNSSQEDDQATEESEEDFEIEFVRFRPVIFEAREGTLRIGIRGSRFVQGDRDFKQSLEVTALYRPVLNVDGTMFLLREDEVNVRFPGRSSVRSSVVRTAVKDQLGSVFPETLLTKSVTIPMTARLAAMRGRVYQTNHVMASDGWLTLGARGSSVGAGIHP